MEPYRMTLNEWRCHIRERDMTMLAYFQRELEENRRGHTPASIDYMEAMVAQLKERCGTEQSRRG